MGIVSSRNLSEKGLIVTDKILNQIGVVKQVQDLLTEILAQGSHTIYLIYLDNGWFRWSNGITLLLLLWLLH